MRKIPRQRITNTAKQELTDADRLELCKLLIKAGYCVKLGKEKPDGKKQYVKYVEYWEDK